MARSRPEYTAATTRPIAVVAICLPASSAVGEAPSALRRRSRRRELTLEKNERVAIAHPTPIAMNRMACHCTLIRDA